MKHIKIAAGMAACFPYGTVCDSMKEALDAGADYVHADTCDMFDLKNQQLIGGYDTIRSVRTITDKFIECHLYAKDVDRIFVEELAKSGCNMLIVPAENFLGAPLAYLIDYCHKFGMKIGLTVGCYAPLCFVNEAIYDIDRLQIVLHGAGNAPEGETQWAWRRSSIEMIKEAKKMIEEKNPNCELAVDGGIRANNLDPIIECNPDVLIFSSAIYLDEDGIASGVQKCRKAIDAAARKYGL